MRWIRLGLCLATLSYVFVSKPACADDDSSSHLLGDWGGLRTLLLRHGVTLTITDAENLLGNLAGGVKQGATLQGVATGTLEVDTGKAFGLPGGTVHISALQIHGQPFSQSYLDSLQPANGNEAQDGTRLWELYYDQQFSRFDIKLGQQSIDNEFLISRNSGLFIDNMAGWPLLPSYDLYGGGPTYPLASLGVRLQAEPTDRVTLLAGVFDDNPGGGRYDDDAQSLDRNGGRFNLGTGALLIAELQVQTNLRGRPGTYKFGGWYDSAAFPDQRSDADGRSLADPAGDGEARMRRGDYSLYAVADQTVWTDRTQSLNAFARVMGAPDDRNLVDFFIDGGLTLSAPLPNRDQDQAGVYLGIGHVSRRAAALDRDSGAPARGAEAQIELTYQAQAQPWLLIQPDVQFIVHPGGGIRDPDDPPPINPGAKLRNELVAGVRAIVTF